MNAHPDARRAGASTARGTLRFRFDGAAYEGLAGDTLASALLANGVHLVGRSFKYHRPRGIVTAGARGAERARDRAPRRGARDAEPARDAGRALRRARGAFAEPLAEPRLRPRPRERFPVADLPGGLLLQDLHVAARGLGGALRAADPPRRGARPRAVAAGPGPIRAALCALRRARRRRGARRARRGARGRRGRRARDPRATSRRSPAARCSTAAWRASTARWPTPGSPGASRSSPAIRACA